MTEVYTSAIKYDVDVDVNELVETVIREAKSVMGCIYPDQDGITVSTPPEGGIHITVLAENQVMSIYCHPTKGHTATAKGKTTGKMCAEPGECAVAIAMRNKDNFFKKLVWPPIVGLFITRNKSFYSVDEYEKYCPAKANTPSSKNIVNTFIDMNSGNNDDYECNINGANNLKHFSFLSIFIILTSIIIL